MTATIIPWTFETEEAKARALFLCRLNELRDLDVATELWVELVQRKAPRANSKTADEWTALRGFLDDIEHAYEVDQFDRVVELRDQVTSEVQA